MLRSEKDVRSWIKKQGCPCWWFEAASGATVGFPDVMVADALGNPSFLELKIMENGRFHAHPSQVNVVRDLSNKGLRAAFLIGKKGACQFIVAGADGLRRVGETKALRGRPAYEVEEVLYQGSDFDRIMAAVARKNYSRRFSL